MFWQWKYYDKDSFSGRDPMHVIPSYILKHHIAAPYCNVIKMFNILMLSFNIPTPTESISPQMVLGWEDTIRQQDTKVLIREELYCQTFFYPFTLEGGPLGVSKCYATLVGTHPAVHGGILMNDMEIQHAPMGLSSPINGIFVISVIFVIFIIFVMFCNSMVHRNKKS